MSAASLPRIGVQISIGRYRIRRLNWFDLLACILFFCAVGSLLGTWLANRQVLEIKGSIQKMQSSKRTPKAAQPRTTEPIPVAPPDSQYLADLGGIFQLAQQHRITLGVMEYKAERNEKLPLLLRSIELGVQEDYPKIKAFLAHLLADFPHVALRELRVERADVKASQSTLMIRLTLVYKAPLGPPAGSANPDGHAR